MVLRLLLLLLVTLMLLIMLLLLVLLLLVVAVVVSYKPGRLGPRSVLHQIGSDTLLGTVYSPSAVIVDNEQTSL